MWNIPRIPVTHAMHDYTSVTVGEKSTVRVTGLLEKIQTYTTMRACLRPAEGTEAEMHHAAQLCKGQLL